MSRSYFINIKFFRVFLIAQSSKRTPYFSGQIANKLFFDLLREKSKSLFDSFRMSRGVLDLSISQIYRWKCNTCKNSPIDYLKSKSLVKGEMVFFDVITSNLELIRLFPMFLQSIQIVSAYGLKFSPYQINMKSFDLSDSIIENSIFQLNFKSPLSFTQGKQYFKWPEPTNLITNLISLWKKWTNENSLEVIDLQNKIWIEKAKGRLSTVRINRKIIHQGWVGQVTYGVHEKYVDFINSLFLLGFFTGVGRGRTVGLGRFDIINHLFQSQFITLV